MGLVRTPYACRRRRFRQSLTVPAKSPPPFPSAIAPHGIWLTASQARWRTENGGGLLAGTVEIDETYVGGKHRGSDKGPYTGNKDIVVGVRQRGGNLRLIHTEDNSAETLGKIIETM